MRKILANLTVRKKFIIGAIFIVATLLVLEATDFTQKSYIARQEAELNEKNEHAFIASRASRVIMKAF